MATGALSALTSRGLRVPDDLSVVGFDDINAGRYASPPLTTVSFDKRAFAEATLDLLAQRIADRARPPRAVVIPHRLVFRDSTRRRISTATSTVAPSADSNDAAPRG
jgi:DNA-binding LacI/PurR family transcriptional regulator